MQANINVAVNTGNMFSDEIIFVDMAECVNYALDDGHVLGIHTMGGDDCDPLYFTYNIEDVKQAGLIATRVSAQRAIGLMVLCDYPVAVIAEAAGQALQYRRQGSPCEA